MPNFDELNVHSVEFDAPLTSDSASAAKRHFSIDLSLELERQLDMETFPPTPGHDMDSHPRTDGTAARESMDPQILAHIVKQLQDSLAEATRDRNELQKAVALSHSHEAELQDALQHMIDKATTMEIELTDARKKIKDDEDAIALLRTKVEESRRGLMRLQTENRRQSLAPVDIVRAGPPSAFGSPPSSKASNRQSFTPLTGNITARPSHGHRRIASVSDSPTQPIFFDKSPNAQVLSFPDHSSTSPYPPNSAQRHSGFFGRTSPSQPDLTPSEQLSAELNVLRKELSAVKDELDHTKHELSESNEAREASETCVKALREFIGENNIGASTTVTLPPPPTMARGDEEGSKKTASTAGWGFKLWGDASAKATPTTPHSAPIAPPPAAPQMPMSATPLSRKLGGFFAPRSSSISLMGPPAIPQLQSKPAPSLRDSVYSASDTSSLVEPVSPPNEYIAHVSVRDPSSLSDSSAGNSPELGKESQLPIRTRSLGVVAT
ncbi:hypothetical protein DXG03_005418 [Asterophora parasitica]|uniref:Uncharacterized protein n=1 Tax=Asterophora parasitica TaxID=117018 RepID=A0A9P7GBK7_9AGAR|nr:hypothetical protein DXG03_005418 [Asterophora parasitica]